MFFFSIPKCFEILMKQDAILLFVPHIYQFIIIHWKKNIEKTVLQLMRGRGSGPSGIKDYYCYNFFPFYYYYDNISNEAFFIPNKIRYCMNGVPTYVAFIHVKSKVRRRKSGSLIQSERFKVWDGGLGRSSLTTN